MLLHVASLQQNHWSFQHAAQSRERKEAEAQGQIRATSKLAECCVSTSRSGHRCNPDARGWRNWFYFFVAKHQVHITEELRRREIRLPIWKPVTVFHSFFCHAFSLLKMLLFGSQLAGVLLKVISQEWYTSWICIRSLHPWMWIIICMRTESWGHSLCL